MVRSLKACLSEVINALKEVLNGSEKRMKEVCMKIKFVPGLFSACLSSTNQVCWVRKKECLGRNQIQLWWVKKDCEGMSWNCERRNGNGKQTKWSE